MSDGKFFEKGAKVEGGKFFKELPGRETGDFHKEANFAYGPGIGAAMSGQMGGSFGVGSSATGGGMYGTGEGEKGEKGKKEKKDEKEKKSPPADSEKKAEAQDDDHGHGWHRPTEDQPNALEAGGGRFLQDTHGGTPANATTQQSALPVKNKSIKKKASDLRFLGTSFEKKSAERGLREAVTEHAKATPGGAASVGRRLVGSAERGATNVVDWAARVAKKGTGAVADDPTLALLALGGGGLLAARGLKRGAGRLARGRGKAGVAAGILSKLRRLRRR